MPALHEVGRIQTFAALVAYRAKDERIVAASDNLGQFIANAATRAMLEQPVEDVLGAELVHSIRNGQGLPTFDHTPELLGVADLGKGLVEASAQGCDDLVVVNLMEGNSPASAFDLLRDLSRLNERRQGATDVISLMTQLSSLVRIMCGYDRVQVLRLTPAGDGKVIAESRRGALPETLGEKVQSIQASLSRLRPPFQIIQSVRGETTPILSLSQMPCELSRFSPALPLLAGRLESLDKQGLAAEMIVPLVLGDHPWGALLFHHRNPRLPSPRFRHACLAMRPLLEAWIARFEAKPESG